MLFLVSPALPIEIEADRLNSSQSPHNLSDRDPPPSAVALTSNLLPEDCAEALCRLLPLDYRVVLRLYGRSISGSWTDQNFITVLNSFAWELPRRKRLVIEAIVEAMKSGRSFIDSISDVSRELSFNQASMLGVMAQTLNAAKAQSTLPAMMDAVNAYRASSPPLAALHRDTTGKKLTRLSIKTILIFQLVVFIFLFLIPEFQKMFEEFGVELPWVMRVSVAAVDGAVKLWFVCAILLLGIGLLLLFQFKYLFARFVARFSPWNWLRRPLSKRRQRKIFLVLAGDLSKNAFEKRELMALDIADSQQAKSWLLKRIAGQNNHSQMVWTRYLVDAFVVLWNLLLAVVVGAIAISVVSCLVEIMRSLSG